MAAIIQHNEAILKLIHFTNFAHWARNLASDIAHLFISNGIEKDSSIFQLYAIFDIISTRKQSLSGKNAGKLMNQQNFKNYQNEKENEN
jgi:hypothetical protein